MAEGRRRRGRGAWADYLGGAPAHPDPIPSGHLAVAGDRLVFRAPGGAQLAIPLADLRGLSLSGRTPEGRRAVRTIMRLAAQHGDATAVLEFAIERRQAAALHILIERELARHGLAPLPRVEQLRPPEEPGPSARGRRFASIGPLLVATIPTLALVALAAFLVLRSESDEGASAAPRSHAGPVPILMYHLIQDPLPTAPDPNLFVEPQDFRAQMKWLDGHRYQAVTLDQVEDAWTRHKTLPPRPVVLSFDDGYQSQAVNAFPILQKLDWAGVLDLKAADADLPDSKVKMLIDAGWELASHTINHVDLTTVSGSELNQEVAGSRHDLQRRFHVPVDNFCYPSGRYDPTVVQAVKAAGYRGATTTDPGLASRDEPFALKRIRISLDDGLPGFVEQLKSAGAV
jgi:peptidoglycan/xylan/chitin deacetylase (PgdA/CDA1 family)